MSKCIIKNCNNETEDGRLLCSRHYAEALLQSEGRMCHKCGKREAAKNSVYCEICGGKSLIEFLSRR